MLGRHLIILFIHIVFIHTFLKSGFNQIRMYADFSAPHCDICALAAHPSLCLGLLSPVIHCLLNKGLRSSYSAPGTVLGAGDVTANKTSKIPWSRGVTSLWPF